MRALILAHDFPPLNSVGARRPYSWFLYFHDYGIEPVIITKSWETKSGSVHDILSHQGKTEVTIEEHPQGKIIRVPIRNILPEKIFALYGENRWKLLRKFLSFVFKTGSFLLWKLDKNRLIYNEAKKFLNENKADVIIATGEPFILFKYASLLSRQFNIPWVADFRDGWFINTISQNQENFIWKFTKLYERFFEIHYLKSAEFLTTVDSILQKKLSLFHRKETYVIFNGFENFYDGKEKPTQPRKLMLSHSGTVYHGHQVEVMLETISELDEKGLITPADLELTFWGLDFFPDQHRRIMQYSRQSSKYIKTTPRISHHEVLYHLSGSDFLVVFTDAEFSLVPSKAYEYVCFKKPVLVVLNDHKLMQSFVTELNAGVLINDKKELRQFLLSNIEAKQKGEKLKEYKPDLAKASFYSRKKQAEIFAFIIKERLADSSYTSHPSSER